MPSQKEREIPTQSSVVSRFYAGKSLFITGAGGFLGLIILEALLRCCPDIRRIYILLRPKRGVQPEGRKELILNKDIFCKLRETNPDALKKVVVVSGDVSQQNLGMCEDDMREVIQEVSVVFHCAAVISFLKSLKFMIDQNVLGTLNVIELCRRIKNMEVLVYTSTAYSNSNRKSIDEQVYELPFTAEQVLMFSKNDDEKLLNYLFEMCNPKFPNYYTFSKCVSENLIAEKTAVCNFPMCIVRPSIIICCLKGVMPGFVEYGSGVVSLSVGIGKGFIRAIRIDEEKISDVIPADVVANTHITGACFQVLDRLPSPYVYNCTSGELSPHTWGEFINSLFTMVLKNPLPKSYQKPGLTVTKSVVKYWILSVFEHYIPAIVIDLLLWTFGGKPRLLKLYALYDKNIKALEPFVMNEWEFGCENFKSLSVKLNSVDSEMFPVDLKDFTLKKLTKSLIAGAPMYRRKDSKPEEERKRITYMRYFFTSLIKWSVLGGIASVFYTALF